MKRLCERDNCFKSGKQNPVTAFFLSVFLWSMLITSLLGVNYCQEDYEFGSQTRLGETETATATASPTATAATSSTPATSTPTPTVTPTGSRTATATNTVGVSAALFGAIKASTSSGQAGHTSAAVPLPTPTQTASGPKDPVLEANGATPLPKNGNWLGQIGIDKKDNQAN